MDTDKTRPQQTPSSPHTDGKLQATAYIFRSIGAPLLAAVIEVQALVPASGTTSKQEQDAIVFSQLIESAAELGKVAAQQLGAEAKDQDDTVRCHFAAAASTVVAAYYRATGKAVLPADATAFALAAQKTSAALTNTLHALPSPGESSEVYLRGKTLSGLAPVAGAVMRYAFGREVKGLVTEIAERLQKTAVEITRAFLPSENATEDWQPIFGTVLDVVGHLYAESHYAEADRLLGLTPEERTAYLARHQNQVSMEPVWNTFQQYTVLLTALVKHLHIPDNKTFVHLGAE